MSSLVRAATSSSAAGTLTVVFLTLGAFLVGGAISFGTRKAWIGVAITGVLAVASFVLALLYYRTYKA